ncbi:MAG: HPr family phosphocarrier protein [Clostridia bacterium]|nr:HPr family phosphocarrier protein [Clostridia bacterium]
MITFEYKIKDEIGLHARPAGLLSKTARAWKSKVLIKKAGKEVDATKLMALMSLGIKNGDVIDISILGEDEEEAAVAIKDFFEKNL